MDIGSKRQTVSIGILRRKIYALICCNIFLVINKFFYGKMTIQTCIHTTCPSITKSPLKSFLEDEMQKLGANQKVKSGIFYVLESGICTGRIRNPTSGIRNPQLGIQNLILSWITLHGARANTWICVVFKMLVDVSQRYTRGFEAICDLIGV